MVDLRRIVVIFVIAVLFTIFVFSSIEAVYPEPRWDDFCGRGEMAKPMMLERATNCTAIDVPSDYWENCIDEEGRIDYRYDSNGCAISYYCNRCDGEWDNAREHYNMVIFIIATILGLIAIIIALYLPLNNEMNEWIGTGFMLGGLFVLFYGTARYFGDLNRFLRPILILAELLIVIYLSYTKLSKTEPKASVKSKKKR